MDNSNQSDIDNQNIINLLKQFSNAGLKFEDAKEKLISQGYTETAINMAADDYEYGSKQTSDIPTKVTEYFQSHPAEAVIDGDNLLKAQRKEDLADERNQAILDAAAASAAGRLGVGNIDAQVEYESKFAFDVGISFWLLIGLGIVINATAYLLVTLIHINKWLYVVDGILSLFIVIFLVKKMK